jgi:hypothetical protein
MVARVAGVGSFVAILAWAGLGRTQDFREQGQFTNGTLTVTITEPDDDAGRIDCVASASDCEPLNEAECGKPGRNIEATVTKPTTTTISVSSELVIWVEDEGNSTDECEIDVAAVKDSEFLIDEVALDATGSQLSTGFEFPDELDPLSTAAILGGSADFGALFTDACAAPERKVYRLCFGVDMGPTMDNKVLAAEPNGWLRILVDTDLPPQPDAEAEGLDGTVRVNADVSDDPEDLLEWEVRLRPALEGDLGETITDPSDCDSWDDYDTKTAVAAGDDIQIDAPGTNGTLYEGCVVVIDEAGNPSTPSPSFYAKPIDQCDFIECWPGDLEVGFCGAGSASLLAALAALGVLLGSRRQR